MNTILIVGIDSAVGANLAATLTGRFHVVGIARHRSIALAGVELVPDPLTSARAALEILSTTDPAQVVLCGTASLSCWTPEASRFNEAKETAVARCWAEAARDFGTRLTVISSDAIFRGPWMFHDEHSDSFCTSAPARAIRRCEAVLAKRCPSTLIVRTNAYGWSPFGGEGGWFEGLIADLESETPVSADFMRHSTPIPATCLAGLLVATWETEATGVLHIAGSERVSPLMFVERMAFEFGLPAPRFRHATRNRTGEIVFGRSETSLRTVAVRKLLSLPLPNVVEGLMLLNEQQENGFRSGLTPEFNAGYQKVA